MPKSNESFKIEKEYLNSLIHKGIDDEDLNRIVEDIITLKKEKDGELKEAIRIQRTNEKELPKRMRKEISDLHKEVQELKDKIEFAKRFVPELDYLFQKEKKKEVINNA